MNSGQKDRVSIRPVRIVLLFLLVLVSTLAYLYSQFGYIGRGDEKVEGTLFTISFALTFENKNSEGEVWNFSEEDKAVSLFMNSSWQTVYLENASYSVDRIELDMDGNPIAFMSFSKAGIRSGENLSYGVAYKVVLKPRSVPEIPEEESGTLSDVPEDLKSLYCGSVGPWQVDDSKLRDLAHEVAGNETSVLALLRRFIEWIRDNITWRTLDVPRYPRETFDGRAGDCDDQANLLITLCRIFGIPAYLQAGCIYVSDKHSVNSYWNGCLASELTRIAWHGWAVVYVPPWGWLPVDLTYVSQSDLRVDALNAVRMSAIIAYPTVQYANVTTTDYVAASRDRRDFLVARDFHIHGHDVMSEETAGEGTRHASLILLPGLLPVFFAVQFYPLPTGLGSRKNHGVCESVSLLHSESL